MTAIDHQWQKVQESLRAEFGDAAFKSWLAPLNFENIDDSKVVLSSPTKFLKDWIQRQYMDRLRFFWHEVNPEIRSVELVIKDYESLPPMTLSNNNDAAAPSETASVSSPSSQNSSDTSETLIDRFDSRLDPRFTFDNFVVGKPNELAFSAAKRIAEDETVRFNPLFLYGGVGLGKTHLMHAIAHAIREKTPERKVIYLSAEAFMNSCLSSL